jgi:hypothetical protein
VVLEAMAEVVALRIFEKNTRRVFPRLDALLKARGR